MDLGFGTLAHLTTLMTVSVPSRHDDELFHCPHVMDGELETVFLQPAVHPTNTAHLFAELLLLRSLEQPGGLRGIGGRSLAAHCAAVVVQVRRYVIPSPRFRPKCDFIIKDGLKA